MSKSIGTYTADFLRWGFKHGGTISVGAVFAAAAYTFVPQLIGNPRTTPQDTPHETMIAQATATSVDEARQRGLTAHAATALPACQKLSGLTEHPADENRALRAWACAQKARADEFAHSFLPVATLAGSIGALTVFATLRGYSWLRRRERQGPQADQ